MSTLPLTVIVPAYNAAATLELALRSAREAGAAQVIVVDDGSTDESAAIADGLADLVIRQANAGAAQARVAGLARATEELVAFLDSDDRLLAEGVRRSCQMLLDDPEASVAAGRLATDDGGAIVVAPPRYRPVTTTTLLQVGFGPWPPGVSVMRRSALVAAGDVDPSPVRPRYAEDYELLIRLSVTGTIVTHDLPCCLYSLAGGKSVKSALKAIESKEVVRAHYASALGIAITPMTPRQRRRSALIRKSRALRSEGRWWAAGWRAAAAVVMNPRSTLATLRRRRSAGRAEQG